MPEFERRQIRSQNSYLVNPAKPDRVMPQPAHAENLLLAQQALGNQATQRFAQSCPLRLPSPSLCPFGGVCHTCPVRAQAKTAKTGGRCESREPRARRGTGGVEKRIWIPTAPGEALAQTPIFRFREIVPRARIPVHPPNDALEREADWAAEAIVTAATTSEGSKVTDVSPRAGAQAADSLLRGNSRFPSNVRGVMNQAESVLGIDLSHVILDTSTGAERLAPMLNARAFTIGKHIAFARGEFRPDTVYGQRLIAHELAHVAQQNRRAKRRNMPGTLTLSNAPTHAIQRTAVAFYTSGDDSTANPSCLGWTRSQMYARYADTGASVHAGTDSASATATLNSYGEHTVQRVLFIGHGNEQGFVFTMPNTMFTAADAGLIQALERALDYGADKSIEFRACDVGQARSLREAIGAEFANAQPPHRATLRAPSGGYNIQPEVDSVCQLVRWHDTAMSEYPLARDPTRGRP